MKKKKKRKTKKTDQIKGEKQKNVGRNKHQFRLGRNKKNSVISWQSVLLVEETRVPGENH